MSRKILQAIGYETPHLAGGAKLSEDAMTDFFEYTELREAAAAMESELESIRAELDAVKAQRDEAVSVIADLKCHTSGEGEYTFVRVDGGKMWIGDGLILGEIFERGEKLVNQFWR